MELPVSNDAVEASPIAGASRRSTRSAPSGDWIMSSLPWMLSIALHALLIATAAAVIFAIQIDREPEVYSLAGFDNDDARFLKADEASLTPVDYAELSTPIVEIDRSQTDLSSLNAELSVMENSDLSIVGIGGEANSGLDGWRALSAGASGPKAEFFGQTGRGQRIVYVIDRSGSMAGSFDFLRSELKRSISELKYSQKFHVILFNGSFTQAPPMRLAEAIAANRKRCFDFLDQVQPEGKTEPIAAMRKAFSFKPDLIFFLTDGEFDRSLVEKLQEWNRKKRVRIFTLGYLYAPGSELLKTIAADNGGTYTFVDGRWIQ